MSASQADEANEEQRRKDKPFGVIAVDKGWLTDEQVQDLLRRQDEGRMRIGEALIELGHIEDAALQSHLDSFHGSQDEVEVASAELPGAMDDNKVAHFVIEVFARTLQRITSVRAKVPTYNVPFKKTDMPVVASVTLRYEQDLSVGLACDEVFAKCLLCGVLDHDPSDDELDAEGILGDATGEFLNIVCGNALAGLEQEGIVADLEPPKIGDQELNAFAYELATTEGKATLFFEQR